MGRFSRYGGLAAAVVGLLLAIALSAPAQALTVKGGDSAHRNAVFSVLCSRPDLLGYVEGAYPDFTVNICYGGHAWKGSIDVSTAKSGRAFTDQVAHEFCHEVQIAIDARWHRGLVPVNSDDWKTLLTSRGYGESTWNWDNRAPLLGRRNPWEAFAEDMKCAFYAPRFLVSSSPNTYLAKVSEKDMVCFLKRFELDL